MHTTSTRLDKHVALDILRQMLLSREGDRRCGILLRQGHAPFSLSSAGHEAVAAMAYHLNADDYIVQYYRDRALLQARGYPLIEFARDFLAKGTHTTAGRSMVVHWTYHKLNILSHSSPTCSQCLPATGVAWSLKLQQKNNVVLCGTGDASTRGGEFYEAVCFAFEKKLPIVFYVADNKYGISTATANMLPFRLNIFAHDIFVKVDGADVFDVYEKSQAAIAKARKNAGPTILWCELDRLDSHSVTDDQRVYRSVDELANLKDPIKIFSAKLIAQGLLTVAEYQNLQTEVEALVEQTYAQALQEAEPDPATVFTHIYGDKISNYPSLKLANEDNEKHMVDIINQTLRAGLKDNKNMIIFGEDVADPNGGVFKFTKGLSTDFPKQVFNSPLAEATIIGTAVGMAAVGMRPVFEIQFIDFITPGLNQLFNEAATLRWRSNNDWNCPMVIYSTYGAYLPGVAAWHGQANEALFAHIPGIRVAIPSTVADAAGLFWAAMHDDDVSLILIPKNLMRRRIKVDKVQAIEFGKGIIRRSGSDVTVVTWGNCVVLAQEAADQLPNMGIEIIDLRTIVPCDWDIIGKSLEKTGRLVVVHEDKLTAGFGGTIISKFTCDKDKFYYLNAPPQLVAGKDVHIPYHFDLEMAVLPQVADIIKAINITME